MECRPGCGACCIAPSISSPIPGMLQGKHAGQRCIQLDPDNRCRLFGQPDRPAVCSSFSARADTCGGSTEEALQILTHLESVTSQDPV